MLKFLTKVWVAGELNDFRKSHNKKKAIKKADNIKVNKEILTEIAKEGKLDEYSKYYGKGFIQMITGIFGVAISPLLPPLAIISLVLLMLSIKNLIKASIIYYKPSKKVKDAEIKRKLENNKFIKELQELQSINNENKGK